MTTMKIEEIRSGLAVALLARVEGLTAALADACADVVVELLIEGHEEAGF